MKFEISNLGYIKQAEIELGDLTIICGKNNTGKTYVNYAIYGFLRDWKSDIDFQLDNKLDKLFKNGFFEISFSDFLDNFENGIIELSRSYSKSVANLFGVDKKFFSDTSFIAKLDKFSRNYLGMGIAVSPGKSYKNPKFIKVEKPIEKNIFQVTLLIEDNNLPSDSVIKSFVYQGMAFIYAGKYFPNPFIITSERTGVSLFYKELDRNKNFMLEKITNKLFDSKQKLEKTISESISRYSQPVQDEINFVRDLDRISKQTGELAKNNPEIIDLLIDIIGGDYSVNDYSMSFKFTEDNEQQEIPLYSASSTVKSLMNLYFYLKHLAKPGDILIIDEPELNLHPENQKKLAKLFTRLTKCGLKLLMTTHSDYLIKEVNNLIILKNDFERKSELMDQYKYSEEDILEPDKVRVYIAENNTLNPAKITPLGIEVPTFDDEIINMTDFYDEAYYEVIDNIDI